jgi:Carboxypeptidase regulatory-like domain
MMLARSLRAASVWMCLAAGSLVAQNPTATLVGTVRDSSGAIVVDAALEVRNTDTGDIRKAVAESKGEFTVPNLAPGPYEVTVSKPGFRAVHETNIVLQLDQVARLEFRLEVGAVTQSVEVTATGAPLINTENGAKGEVMTSDEMVEMPLNGRNFGDLAYLVEGVTPNTRNLQGSGFAVNGARPDNTNFVIDGFEPAFFHNGSFTRLEDAIYHHLNVFESARSFDPRDLTLRLGPIEPVLARVDPLLARPTQLTPDEFESLVAFVRTGLLDPRAEPRNLCSLIPATLPSGMPPLRFEQCPPPAK